MTKVTLCPGGNLSSCFLRKQVASILHVRPARRSMGSALFTVDVLDKPAKTKAQDQTQGTAPGIWSPTRTVETAGRHALGGAAPTRHTIQAKTPVFIQRLDTGDRKVGRARFFTHGYILSCSKCIDVKDSCAINLIKQLS